MRLPATLPIAALIALIALLILPAGALARPSLGVHLSVGVPLHGGAYARHRHLHGVHGFHGGLYHPYHHPHGGAPRALWLWPPVVVLAARPWEPVPAERDMRAEPPAVSVPPSRPDPVIYPRSGQDGQQTEFDRQQCNRWATTQPAAMADAGVFHSAVEACMDGRGYSMR